ncbi:hypothetical protein VFPPC_16369 [Pochonia chlamydosporia 170]|uniref:Uncharacterized protein n=1 Tax=Pochonia chlamydosporia 170 TaxID=1380566 RepID=A0A179FB55_METCM|nr:hypothetical protein VFPPC_16369 [Pochonia chlamydosporia 170]OAQ62686.1 hypothetical protein VFPPC_16369 [Pochonia chlamydosporia 170]
MWPVESQHMVRMRANCLITQFPPLTPCQYTKNAGSNGSKSSVTLLLSALSVAILFAARGQRWPVTAHANFPPIQTLSNIYDTKKVHSCFTNVIPETAKSIVPELTA